MQRESPPGGGMYPFEFDDARLRNQPPGIPGVSSADSSTQVADEAADEAADDASDEEAPEEKKGKGKAKEKAVTTRIIRIVWQITNASGSTHCRLECGTKQKTLFSKSVACYNVDRYDKTETGITRFPRSLDIPDIDIKSDERFEIKSHFIEFPGWKSVSATRKGAPEGLEKVKTMTDMPDRMKACARILLKCLLAIPKDAPEGEWEDFFLKSLKEAEAVRFRDWGALVYCNGTQR